jgi:hypothetical protein
MLAMDATTVIAIYAAVVATAALFVEYAQWRSSRTQLKIETYAGVAPILSEELDGHGNELHKQDEVLFIRLTNRSPHGVKITHVGAISANKDDKEALFFARPYPLDFPLPFQIAARDNVTLWLPRNQLEEWEGKRMQAAIQTAAGDDVESSTFRLEDLPRLEIVGNRHEGGR